MSDHGRITEWAYLARGALGPEPLFEVNIHIFCEKVNQITMKRHKINYKEMQNDFEETPNNYKEN